MRITIDREELLRSARNLYENPGTNEALKVVLEETYPELKVGEDERIRLEIHAYLFNTLHNTQRLTPRTNELERWLAYLEKQKEQKPVKLNYDTEVGLNRALQIVRGARGNLSGYQSDDGIYECDHAIQTLERILKNGIEQQPAESDAIKGGDFISDGKRVFLVLANVKERNLGETGSTFCEGLILGVDGVVYCNGDDFKKFKRATSDERAKFIYDLKVGVKLKEQPAEWSEEDEFFRRQLIVYCDNCVQDSLAAKCVDWLKSLRPQPHWKPSEEQMNRLGSIIAALRKDFCDDMADFLASLLYNLKKLT